MKVDATTNSKLRAVPRSTLVDDCYAQLRHSVVSGHFKPGQRVVESRVAAEMAVSRGTVRAALRRLAGDGLVEEVPHRGCIVREITIEEIVDVFNTRVGIETSAIRLCTKLCAPTTRLRKHIDEMQAAADRGDTVRLSEGEYAFHETLCELSGNAYLLQVFRSIAAQIRLGIGRDTELTGRPDAAPQAHRPLVEAIEAGDESMAAELLEYHMNQTLVAYLDREQLRWLHARVLTPGASTLPPELLRIVGGLGGEPAGADG